MTMVPVEPTTPRAIVCARCGFTNMDYRIVAGIRLSDAQQTPLGAVMQFDCPGCGSRFTLTDWFHVNVNPPTP